MRQFPLHLSDPSLERRPTVDRRRFRLSPRRNPSAVGSRPVPKDRRLKEDLVALMAGDPDVLSVVARPETYSWRDGHDGKRHAFVPDYLVVMSNGSKIYRSIRTHTNLLRDPELSGRRTRIELECAIRGGSFEIWTEREIREPTNGWPLLRVASLRDAEDLERSLRELGEFGSPKPPSLVTLIAERLGLSQPRHVGKTFLARSLLTGILMAVLCELRPNPKTGALVWKSTPRLSRQGAR